MKDNIGFYTHDTDMGEHPKSKALIAVYGFEGYGRFLRLNELIGKASGCKLDLSRKLYLNQVAGELKMSPAQLQQFIDFLADPNECGLLQVVDNVLTTDRTQADLQVAMSSRERARRSREGTSRDGAPTVPHEEASVPHDEPESPHENHDRPTDRRKEAAAGAEFQSWLKTTAACDRSVRNPAALIRAVIRNPTDERYAHFFGDFEAERRAASAKAPPPPPPPRRCDACGSTAIRSPLPDSAQCTRCGRMFDLVERVWVPDPATGRAPPGTAQGVLLEGAG